ncbi:hypothetical protein SynRCC2555_00058 [Synechococcus sp. WH 8101]|nr:hypothetical protein SynRCC2555_00058 [Synechococcus sp. WH 8101]
MDCRRGSCKQLLLLLQQLLLLLPKGFSSSDCLCFLDDAGNGCKSKSCLLLD